MIKCGHCKGHHATVPEVKACSARGPVRPPNGRYAVDLPDGRDVKLRFFIITDSKFLEQAGPNTYLVHPSTRAAIARAIMKDPLAAMIRYGKELRICGAPNCGLPLTKKISRDRGMGPVCWGRFH